MRSIEEDIAIGILNSKIIYGEMSIVQLRVFLVSSIQTEGFIKTRRANQRTAVSNLMANMI